MFLAVMSLPNNYSYVKMISNGLHPKVKREKSAFKYSIPIPLKETLVFCLCVCVCVFSLRQVMSCSEDGSVRIWELQELPLPAEPASSGEKDTPPDT